MEVAALLGVPLGAAGPAGLAGLPTSQMQPDRLVAVVGVPLQELRMRDAVVVGYLEFESKLRIPVDPFGSTTDSTILVAAFTPRQVVKIS